MAGAAGDSLRHISDNPTGAGDIPVVSTDQVENNTRPGGREHLAAGRGDAGLDIPRPGGQEGGAVGAGDPIPFARPGGQEKV